MRGRGDGVEEEMVLKESLAIDEVGLTGEPRA